MCVCRECSYMHAFSCSDLLKNILRLTSQTCRNGPSLFIIQFQTQVQQEALGQEHMSVVPSEEILITSLPFYVFGPLSTPHVWNYIFALSCVLTLKFNELHVPGKPRYELESQWWSWHSFFLTTARPGSVQILLLFISLQNLVYLDYFSSSQELYFLLLSVKHVQDWFFFPLPSTNKYASILIWNRKTELPWHSVTPLLNG